MDEPPRRPRYLPAWLVILVVAGVVIVLGAAIGVVTVTASGDARVPALVGSTEVAALNALQRVGLTMEVGGTRYSVSVPRGQVVAQEPEAGAWLRQGARVTVILSAGAEKVTVPAVVGADVGVARTALADAGLSAAVRRVESTATLDSVLSADPPEGTSVPVGSEISLTVASRSVSSPTLLPYRMTGVGVLIDAVGVDFERDVTLEVQRRLRALLQASEASVAIVRSAASSGVDASVRRAAAAETTAAVMVTLDVAAGGGGGLRVVLLPRDAASSASKARQLGETIAQAARSLDQPSVPLTAADDAVLAAAPCPSVKIILGSTAQEADVADFGDPEWLDAVAQALYRALGTVFGRDSTS